MRLSHAHRAQSVVLIHEDNLFAYSELDIRHPILIQLALDSLWFDNTWELVRHPAAEVTLVDVCVLTRLICTIGTGLGQSRLAKVIMRMIRFPSHRRSVYHQESSACPPHS
jgi:hypothetical protein